MVLDWLGLYIEALDLFVLKRHGAAAAAAQLVCHGGQLPRALLSQPSPGTAVLYAGQCTRRPAVCKRFWRHTHCSAPSSWFEVGLCCYVAAFWLDGPAVVLMCNRWHAMTVCQMVVVSGTNSCR